MDKLMDNRWFMKIVALLLALLLYSSVPQSNNKNTEVNVPGEKNTETITDVPVNAYYDTDNLVVSGLPDTVEMTVNGPNPHVQSAKALRNFEVYIDLSKAKIGTQTVKLRIKGLSDKLTATLEPAFANISIQEKITKEFNVEAEYNQSMIKEGYIAERPIVEPNKIKVTGAKEIIDRIAYVKATVDVKNPIQDTITREARIRILDRELNKLEVVVEPETVDVTIPVKSSNKTVPIKIVQKGTPPPGVDIESISLDTKEAVIIAPEEVLKNTESVRVEVDVSKISEETTLTLPVIISNGIVKVTPETVKANIKVKKMESKTLSGLTINSEGLSDDYQVEFKNPADGKAILDVFGNSNTIKKLDAKDFNLFVDLSGLKEGDHEVEIQVKGPSSINWKLEKETAQMTITKSEA
jgi:YbbR domain-containing protein